MHVQCVACVCISSSFIPIPCTCTCAVHVHVYTAVCVFTVEDDIDDGFEHEAGAVEESFKVQYV